MRRNTVSKWYICPQVFFVNFCKNSYFYPIISISKTRKQYNHQYIS